MKGLKCSFKSQRKTYHNEKVNFTNPLPSWLKGTYVSKIFVRIKITLMVL